MLKTYEVISTWKLWDDDIEKFKHELELYKKLGEELDYSFSDSAKLPEESDMNAGRTIVVCIVSSSNETFKRLDYIFNN